MSPPVTIKVELFYSSIWNDISTYCYTRDPITIKRGTPNEASSNDPASCTLTLNNRDGRFSLHNPASPLYGLIVRNTPIRITATAPAGSGSVRFVGEVSSWPVSWDNTGTDVYVQIQAAGVTRRLAQGQSAANTDPMDTYIGSTGYMRYWQGATAYDKTRTKPLIPLGCSPVFGGGTLGFDSPVISLPDTGLVRDGNGYYQSGYIEGLFESYELTHFGVGLTFQADSLGQFGFVVTSYGLGSTSSEWEVILRGDGVNNDVQVINRSGFYSGGTETITVTVLGDTAPLAAITDGAVHTCFLKLDVNGTGVDWRVYIDGVSVINGTLASQPFDPAYEIHLSYVATGTNTNVNVGYIAGWNGSSVVAASAYTTAAFHYAGENAADRIERLCNEYGITWALFGTDTDTRLMGAQSSGKILDLLNEAADTDMGFLFDSRTVVGLSYVTRTNLYNATPVMTIDYTAKVLTQAPDPTDDDLNIHNDVTATNTSTGGSAEQTLMSGALSVQAPPNGINTYSTSISVNAVTDAQLPDLASWFLYKSTIDKPRYPTLTTTLLTPALTSSSTLTNNVLRLDVSSQIALTNLPSWLPPDAADLIVIGTSETIAQDRWDLVLNCAPADIYSVAVWGSGAGGTYRYDAENSTVNTGFNTTATSLSIASASNTSLWTTTAGEMPFDINVAGERMTVSAVSGSSSPQTFTVTRSVNGVVKSHSAGEAVHLYSPARYAL